MDSVKNCALQFKARWVPALRGKFTRVPPLTKKLFGALQLITAVKGNISFLPWVFTEYISHTPGEVLWPG